jgi:hypothetical protein
MEIVQLTKATTSLNHFNVQLAFPFVTQALMIYALTFIALCIMMRHFRLEIAEDSEKVAKKKVKTFVVYKLASLKEIKMKNGEIRRLYKRLNWILFAFFVCFLDCSALSSSLKVCMKMLGL